MFDVYAKPCSLNIGSHAGLQLRINIEQYEYMKGPNSGAGIKLHIHDQKDVPMVKNHGLAVAPGAHAFIAVNLIEVCSWTGFTCLSVT